MALNVCSELFFMVGSSCVVIHWVFVCKGCMAYLVQYIPYD